MNITEFVFGREPQGTPSLDCQQPKTALPKEMPIGMLYVPYQTWQKLYDPVVALDRGTIFEELDKPFIGERTI